MGSVVMSNGGRSGRRIAAVAGKRQARRPLPVVAGGQPADGRLGLAADDRIDAATARAFPRAEPCRETEQEHEAAPRPRSRSVKVEHRPQLQRRTLPAVQGGTGDADQVGFADACGDLPRAGAARPGRRSSGPMAVGLEQRARNSRVPAAASGGCRCGPPRRSDTANMV